MEHKLSAELKEHIDGEVHCDALHKKIYSVDASIYEVEPICIVIPKTKQAILKTLKIAKKYHAPVIPRGAATGITGGCIGHAIIIDTSKYLNKILKIDFENEYAICEPGVVQDSLNQALSSKGYRLGPDTSTGNRATLGGMVGNNAAGARSLFYGKMSDHVLEIELALASDELLHFKAINGGEWASKRAQKNREGKIYEAVHHICEHYRTEIEERFPKIPRRVSGYNLDELIKPGPLNLCKVIAGSEGTLGIITEVRVRISKKPRITGLSIVHFHDMIEAMKSIPQMLAFNPLSLEMIDEHIIAMGSQSPAMKGKLQWLRGKPQAVFVAEFEGGDAEEVNQKLNIFEAAMKQHAIGYAQVRLNDPSEMSYVWDVRKAGLGLLLSKRTYSRAIAFIEDITIDPYQLAPFMAKFKEYLHNRGKEAGIYGHVGSGCMHVRPFIDLREVNELNIMENMMNDVSSMLLEFGGAMSGEHGDGRVRSWLNKKMFGDRLYQAFVELKEAFDPENRMNPDKVVNGTPFLEELRLSPETKIASIETFLNFDREGGFELAVDMCNGNGMCRKTESVMCPSFHATRDEYDTTRARAQSLRAIVNGRLPIEEIAGDAIHDVLDLCLECKGCKTECPSQVDMAKMKAELLYQHQEKNGYSLRSKLFGNIGLINRVGSRIPSLFNAIAGSKISKWALGHLGIAHQRDLPPLALERFSTWFKGYQEPGNYEKSVILFNDTYNEFNTPQVGKAAVKILNALGYHVVVPEWHCCGRPMMSKGFLKQAKAHAEKVINLLHVYVKDNLPIIGLEPSCLFMIRDDFYGLISKENKEMKTKIEEIEKACVTLDEFLNAHLQGGKLPLKLKENIRPIKLHGHCHQKSLVSTKPSINVLKSLPGASVSEIPSGCCGVAGSFGYEKEHYELSMKIGELHLLPAVRAASEDALFVANGVSCRSQIAHGAGRTAKHLAEAVAEQLE